MKIITGYPRLFITITIIVTSIVLLTQCMEKNDTKSVTLNSSFEKFSGSAVCANCHKDIYNAHLKTAHFLTSTSPLEQSIHGNFEPGKNVFAFNANTSVAMEKRSDGLYQVQYENGIEKKARRFGMVIGSGTKGQSFLHWQDDLLFQMPVTYFSAAKEWSNSPGFPSKPIFNRVITSRCLECHSTYVGTTPGGEKQPDRFDKNRILLGVDCEKCHGPAAEHVAFQTKHPADSIGKYILNPDDFSRQQKLDLCALCHGGRLQKTKPSFSFTAGEKLADFFVMDTSAPDPDNIDVHGNQYGLMRASACFKKSMDLTCNSCHNPHENEKGKTALFSQRCMSCHNDEHNNFCKLDKTFGAVIKTNCIDCHMPVKPSKAIAVFLPGKAAPTAAMIRSHFISINPSLTAIMIRELKKRKPE
jgi:hypothetical protein